MEETFLDDQGEFQDEKSAHISLNSNNGLEDDNISVCGSSELKTAFVQKSCLQSQCGNELTIQNYTSLVNPSKNPAQHCSYLTEFGASNSLSIICRAPSSFSVPTNLRSSKFIFESLNTRRRTRSANDLGSFVIQYASLAGPGNVNINPFGQWITDTREGNEKVRNILKGSLFFRFGDLDSNLRLNRSKSGEIRETKSSELNSSPSRLYNTLSKKPNAEVVSVGKQRSASKISDKMLVSCSSTNSTSSFESTSSAHCTTSKGVLHCGWKSGIPCFVFTVDDGRREVYVANPRKVESSDDKALDYMYLFHSSSDRKREFGGLVGKMKVSSSISFNSNRSKFMETEFVLFGASEDHSRETQNSSSTLMKNKGLSKKMVDIFRTNHSFKHKSAPRVGEPCLDFEDIKWECIDKLNKLDESDHANLLNNNLPSNLELASIVVKECQHDGSKEETAVGGWGLKFLENVTVEHAESCRGNCVREKNGYDRSINVLVPAGFHGVPITLTGGRPSSLTERWRSGGHCDCGGWDIGCPLTVLSNRSTNSKVFRREDPQEDHKSVDLFIEGAKQGEPTLKMVNKQEGLYFIYFQSNLSALQAFSIGVAIIHARTPTLFPKL